MTVYETLKAMQEQREGRAKDCISLMRHCAEAGMTEDAEDFKQMSKTAYNESQALTIAMVNLPVDFAEIKLGGE